MNRRVNLGVRTLWPLLAFCLFLFPHPSHAQGLPAGWASGDVGAVGAGGWATGVDDRLWVYGSGTDIWEYSDGFQFAYRVLHGDGSIVARVGSVDYQHAWSKAGVMMRESLADTGAHAFMLVTAGQGTAFQRRPARGAASTHTAGPGSNSGWVKLVRTGDAFNAYYSDDGSHWSHVGGEWIPMASTIYVGVAVTSHRDGAVSGASFSHVAVANDAATPPDQGVVAPIEPPPSSWGGGTLKVLQWNVHHGGVGTDGVLSAARVADWIAYMNPDVASLNEVDGEWHVWPIVDRLEAVTGQQWHAVWGGPGQNLLLSKLPVSTQSACAYNASLPRYAPHVAVAVGGRTVNVWSTHLDVNSGGTRAAEVLGLQACAGQWSGATILAGDFNMQTGTYEYQLAAAGFTDAWPTAQALGSAQNYSGNCNGCTRNSRIDYVFSSEPWNLRVVAAQIFDTRDGNGYMPSDHKPMLVTYAID